MKWVGLEDYKGVPSHVLPQYWDLLPAHSLQQLPLISHFKHYLIYVLAQPVVHILHFFSLIASLCARDMWIYQKVQIEREKRGWKDSNSLIENKSLHIFEHVGIYHHSQPSGLAQWEISVPCCINGALGDRNFLQQDGHQRGVANPAVIPNLRSTPLNDSISQSAVISLVVDLSFALLMSTD